MTEPHSAPPVNHLWCYLTQAEWRLCYALAFVDLSEEERGVYGLSEASPHPIRGWESAIQAAVVLLGSKYRYPFQGLKVDSHTRDIELYDQVGEGNIIYLVKLLSGALPASPLLAIEAAIPMASNIGLDPGPLEHSFRLIQQSLQEMVQSIEDDLELSRAVIQQKTDDLHLLNRLRGPNRRISETIH